MGKVSEHVLYCRKLLYVATKNVCVGLGLFDFVFMCLWKSD